MEHVTLTSIRPNPANPRVIRDRKFHALVASILLFPQMLTLRPIIVIQDNTIVGGNMRYKALQYLKSISIDEIFDTLQKNREYRLKTSEEQQAIASYWMQWKDKPTAIIERTTLAPSQVKEFIIKDNASYGEWDYDMLANEWDAPDLNDWGVDVWNIDKPHEETNEDPEPEIPNIEECICPHCGKNIYEPPINQKK